MSEIFQNQKKGWYRVNFNLFIPSEITKIQEKYMSKNVWISYSFQSLSVYFSAK